MASAVAYIGGRPAPLPEAIAEAARQLSQARLPVVAGLAADVAGIRAAILLARRLRGAFDHMAADAVLASLGAMRDGGWMIVSPAELRRRADLVLIAGAFPEEDWPGLFSLMPEAPSGARVVALGTGRLARRLAAIGYASDALDCPAAEMPALMAALRARLAGRPVAVGTAWRKLDGIAQRISAACFGVAVWHPSSLDRLTTEMLAGLVKDLNVSTRFSGLPWPASDNGSGVAQVSGWLTGYPMRTGFGRGKPEHDPWRYHATRLVESGDADAALWLSAYRPVAPDWSKKVPLVALTAKGANFAAPPEVRFEVGIPGIDHDAVEFRPESGMLGHVTAERPSELPSAAAVLGGIISALPQEGAE